MEHILLALEAVLTKLLSNNKQVKYMIKLTDLIVENNLREYSDEEKRKMGIPSGAVSRGGVWYVGDKYAGQVINGKFVAANAPAKAHAKASIPSKAAPSAKGRTSTPTAAKADKIASAVKDKIAVWADENYETWEERGGEDIPTAEFSKMTGIPEDALRVYGRTLRDPEEDGIYYDLELDTFSLGGFPDRIIKQFLGPVADRTPGTRRR